MRKHMLYCIILAFAVVTMACSNSASLIDYNREESWLALPEIPSPANMTPKESGFSDLQQHARADVFYVHPTTGMREDVLNVPIDDSDALKVGHIMLMSQATAFNGIARIFAPRYRQIALYVYDLGEEVLQEPMSFAYKDVRRAFRHARIRNRPDVWQSGAHSVKAMMISLNGNPSIFSGIHCVRGGDRHTANLCTM